MNPAHPTPTRRPRPRLPYRPPRARPRRGLGAVVLLAVLGLLAQPQPALALERENLPAINTSFLNDWASVIYADALQQRRDWNKPAGGAAAVNDFSHPTEEAKAYLNDSMPLRAGTYRVYHNGVMTVAISRGTLGGFQPDPATGFQVATWVLESRTKGVQVTVSNVSKPATFFRILRPVAEGSPESHAPDELFDRVNIASLGPTRVLRFMDALSTNSNPSVTWAARIRPHQWPRLKTSTGAGMPWEHIVLFANRTGIDPWINLPHGADDEYITKLARLFRHGSNGTEPFTSDAERETAEAAGTTVYPPLDPSRTVYLEYSNEIWNSGFGQTAATQSAALAEAAAHPDSPLLYDGIASSAGNYQRVLLNRRVVMQTVKLSNAFRAEFGDEAMGSRVRPLLLWQKENSNSHGSFRVHFLADYYGQVRPGHPVARPPSYYVWGAGAATYYSPTTSGLEIWNDGAMDPETWKSRLVVDGALALANGLHYVSYEGGPGFGDANGGSGAHPYAEQLVKDARIYDEVIEHHEYFQRHGGSMLCYYEQQGGIDKWQWTFTFFVDDPPTHKMRAYRDLAGRPRPPETCGHRVPAEFKGGDLAILAKGRSYAGNASPNNSQVVTSGGWAVYGLLAETAGRYTVEITTSGGAAGRSLEVWLDGEPLGSRPATAAGTSAPLSFALAANRRACLRVQAIGGDVTVTRLKVAHDPTAPGSIFQNGPWTVRWGDWSYSTVYGYLYTGFWPFAYTFGPAHAEAGLTTPGWLYFWPLGPDETGGYYLYDYSAQRFGFGQATTYPALTWF